MKWALQGLVFSLLPPATQPTCETAGVLSIWQLWKLKLRDVKWVDQGHIQLEKEELKLAYRFFGSNSRAFFF